MTWITNTDCTSFSTNDDYNYLLLTSDESINIENRYYNWATNYIYYHDNGKVFLSIQLHGAGIINMERIYMTKYVYMFQKIYHNMLSLQYFRGLYTKFLLNGSCWVIGKSDTFFCVQDRPVIINYNNRYMGMNINVAVLKKNMSCFNIKTKIT